MFKLFKARVRVITLGKLVSYCTHVAEVILEDGGEIKTELLKPLRRIFLEVIKANK